MAVGSDQETPKCARHPNVETGLRCAACGTPICPDCMVETPVGMKCPDCGRLPLPSIYRLTPGTLLIAVVVAAALSAVAAALALVLRLGFLAIFLGPFAGGLIGEAASRAAGWKRGPAMARVAAISSAIGLVFLGPQIVSALIGGRALSVEESLSLLAVRPFFLVFAGLAVAGAVC